MCVFLLLFLADSGTRANSAKEVGRLHDIETAAVEEIGLYMPAIRDESEHFGIDPALIIGILYVEKTQYVLDDWLRFRDGIERMSAEFVIFGRSLVEWADLSTGYTRIKPSFAGEVQRRLCEYPQHEDVLSVQDVDPSVYQDGVELSVRIMAAGLFLLQDEWARAGFPIEDRPDIVATLYNLGFEKSLPHGDPIPGGSVAPIIVNGVLVDGLAFGTRVATYIEESDLVVTLLAGDR